MNIRHYNLIFVLAVFAFTSSGCDFYYKNMPFVPIPPQTISGPVVIGSEWIEIIPPEPLNPIGSTNWISLGCTGYKEFKLIKPNKENILELADGRNTKIEAFLFDDKGANYDLELSLSSAGPELYKRGEMKLVNGVPDYSETKFPSDRFFTKLKIRSAIPVKCDKIEWIGSKPQ